MRSSSISCAALVKKGLIAPNYKNAIHVLNRQLHLHKKQMAKSQPGKDKFTKSILNDLFIDPVVLKSSMILLPEEFKIRQLRVYKSGPETNYSLVPHYEVFFDKCSVLERLAIYSEILSAKGFTEGFPELPLEHKTLKENGETRKDSSGETVFSYDDDGECTDENENN